MTETPPSFAASQQIPTCPFATDSAVLNLFTFVAVASLLTRVGVRGRPA
jgi:hypothetical protein